MARKAPSPNDELLVLVASRRRCCLCYGFDGDLTRKAGQIAHLDRNPENSELGNLAYLCLEHHDWFDSKTSQSKGPTTDEAKHYRQKLYAALERRDNEELEPDRSATAAEPAAPELVSVPLLEWARPAAEYPAFLGATPEPRVFLAETPREIKRVVKSLPPLDRDDAARAYVGKWLRLRGQVFSVDCRDDIYSVSLSGESGPLLAMLTYPLAWRPDVESLREGDQILVEGQIRYATDHVELIYPRVIEQWRPAVMRSK